MAVPSASRRRFSSLLRPKVSLTMHTALLALVLFWALCGHLGLCVAFINRAHATGIPTRVGKLLWLSMAFIVPSVPIFFGYWFWLRARHLGEAMSFSTIPPAAVPYLVVCLIAALLATLEWFVRRILASPPDSLLSDRRRVVRLLQHAAGPSPEDHDHHMLVHLPGNQILDLDVAERGLCLPGLPEALNLLTVVHLSDLHFTGRVAKAYFEEVVQICNDLKPDLIAVTGDLLDSRDCLDWIPDTFGQLKSRYGNYFILGNHDVHVGPETLRRQLEEVGMIDLGGRWVEVSIGEEKIVLAGNELPWLPPAADFRQAPPASTDGGRFRIALTHSPDQLPWARRNEVDLLLAGHLHGGQIRLPLIGPLVSPSWRGVTYASGVFQDSPTVMHVSRGVSGELPVRLNCPPEVAKLTLHAGSHHGLAPDGTS